MSKSSVMSRMTRAKNEMTHSRSSVTSLKKDFKQHFLTRLRTSRSQSVDQFRQIVEDCSENISYNSINELRNLLLTNPQARELLESDDVHLVLQQIEEEFQQEQRRLEAQLIQTYVQSEVDDDVNRLLDACEICGNESIDFKICSACVQAFMMD